MQLDSMQQLLSAEMKATSPCAGYFWVLLSTEALGTKRVTAAVHSWSLLQ